MANSTPWSLKSRRNELPVPRGRNASVGGLAGPRKKAVDDFVGSAVAADGDELPISLGVGVAGQRRRLARSAGFDHVQSMPPARKRSSAGPTSLRQRPPPAAGIDHREKRSGIDHSGRS